MQCLQLLHTCVTMKYCSNLTLSITLLVDKGGPLYDKINDVLVGVTSWGIGCAMGKFNFT